MDKFEKLVADINQALISIAAIEHLIIAYFENGRTFNPSELRDHHNQVKSSLANIGEALANGGK